MGQIIFIILWVVLGIDYYIQGQYNPLWMGSVSIWFNHHLNKAMASSSLLTILWTPAFEAK